MGRPRLHHTEKEWVDALRACWRAYSAQHRESRRLLNKPYVQRPEVKKRRKELYQAKKVARKLVEHGEPMLSFVLPRTP